MSGIYVDNGTKRRSLSRAAAAGALAALALAGCTPSHPAQVAAPAPSGSAAPAATPVALAITPGAGAKGLPVSTEIGITLGGGSLNEVSLVKTATGEAVFGMLRDDAGTNGGTSWVPMAPLAYATQYTATVSARSADGTRTETRTTTFTTMGRPGQVIATGLYLDDGETVGVGMPVALEFDEEVPEAARTGVQQRLFVATNPPQPGVWHWASGRQVWYRAPDYWKPGTTITVRAALEGVPMGNGRYGDTDRSATVTVGNKIFIDADNATKQMRVFVDDRLARTVPVSLGKPSTPSSSGMMVLMTKERTRTFDTRNEGPGGYVVDVNWAMRLTWGGEFIHAAPWSVADQGVRNVSHGCVNMSDENAQWLFGIAHIGDPILVRGTEVSLADGNGWTAWNETWGEYVRGSALPVPPDLAAATGVDPRTGTEPPPAPVTSASPAPAAQPTPTR